MPRPTRHRSLPPPLGCSRGFAPGPAAYCRLPSSTKRCNALGAHSRSYSICRALSVATGSLSRTHKPDYAQTEPPASIPPQSVWADPTKIVSFDPRGRLVQQLLHKEVEEKGLDTRPSAAAAKAYLKMSTLDKGTRKEALKVDGRVALKSPSARNADGLVSEVDSGVEAFTSKAAVEPVRHLPEI